MTSINKKRVVVTLVLSLFIIFAAALPALAADGIVPSECRAGLTNNCDLCKLFSLADNFIDFMLFSLAIPIVILALLYGGFLITTSGGNVDRVKMGRKAVTNAVVGTLIMFLAWAAINTLVIILGVQLGVLSSSNRNSPAKWFEFPGCAELTKIDGAITPPPSGGENPPPPPAVGAGEYTHEEAIAKLNQGITTNKPGCTDQQNASCTSLTGIPRDAIDNINLIQSKCNCNITITGGTEVGHASHGPGKPIVDFRASAQTLSAIQEAGYAINANFGRGATCESGPGIKTTCGTNENHIHMEL